MPQLIDRPFLTRVLLGAASIVVLSACQLNLANAAEAHDTWTKSYTLAPGGTLEIHNTNGLIDVQPGTDPTIEIVAERIVHAATDQGAKDALQSFEVRETIAPDRVAIDATMKLSGIFTGSREMRFHIKAPKGTNVQLHSTNGEITARDMDGAFEAHGTNGDITGTGLSGRAVVGTTNGGVQLTLARVTDEGVSIETTNGDVNLTVPRDAKARISASVTNGDINYDGLQIDTSEKSRRKLAGTIGGGGGMIRLSTTNGGIELHGK